MNPQQAYDPNKYYTNNLQVGVSSPATTTGGTLNPQQTSSIPLQPTYNPQTTANPMDYTSFGSTGDSGATLGATTPTATVAPEYDAAAAQRAADLAEANALRGTFTSLFSQINDIYDSIYGRIGTVGAEKAGQVQERYGKETGALAEQFTKEFPRIGNAYAARNAGDSSYRYDAEQLATGQYDRVVGDLATQRDSDLATAGQYVANEQGAITADKGKLTNIAIAIAESEDPAELRALQTEYRNLKVDLEQRDATTQSQASLTNTANQLVDTRDRTASLQAGLTSIITGAAPNALKQQVAMGMIEQSGLSPADQERMIQWFGGQLAPEEEQTPVTG